MRKTRKHVERFRESVLPGLAGSEATLRLVIDEAVINELVAESFTSRQSELRELRFTFEDDNRVKVVARSTRPLIPKVALQCEIERDAILEPAPAVRVRLLKRGFSHVIGPLLSTFADRLPPDVTVSGEHLELDLATLLDRWNLSWVLTTLVSLEIETFVGQVQVALELRA
jgi:hypothetical protein